MMKKKDSGIRAALFQTKPWEDNENNIWLASTINILRNLDKFSFPARLEKERRGQVISLVSKALLSSPKLENPLLIKTEDIGPLEKEYLFEHYLSDQSFLQAHSGEAFIVDESGKFLTTLNVSNHIQFELIDCKGDLESAWNRIVKIETNLGKSLKYAFSPKYGFLTANPGSCGTGFILRVFLQPSALIHTGEIENVLKELKTDGIRIAGLQGDPNQIIGDVYVIRNNHTLGLTEENIISMVRLFTTKLMIEENRARTQLKENPIPEVKDRISRAYGLLIHSYQIDAAEALDAISLLKLGADLGWLEGVAPAELNRLFFKCRRGHLLAKDKEEIEKEEVAHHRASFIHDVLKKAKLTIRSC